MERRSDSRQYSLRGKMWMMVVLLAVTNCVSGAAIFVVASVLSSDARAPMLLTVLVSILTTVGFGWLISNDVLRPLDRLNLLAKSIERSPGMAVPSTTGAVETDDLLHTISRASRQLTNFVDLMDDVTAGNTKAALDPLEHSDRLSESFRRLVAKVTDSIDAKAELDQLKNAVRETSMEVAGLERGEIVRVKNDFAGTRPITDALRFLIDRHVSMTHAVGGNATEMRMIVGDNAKRFASMIEKDAARERVLRKACSSIAEAAADSDRSMRSLASSLTSIDDILAELRTTASTDAEMVKTQAAIRRQFDSAIHKLRDVGEQSLAITHVAKAVQDLAKRSKMIALNTTIQAGDESSCGLATLTQEIVSLSERAEKANKAIAGIGDSIVRDVNQANASVQWLTTEVAKVSARSARTEESLLLLSDNLSPLAGVSKRVETEGAAALARLDDSTEMLTDCVNRSEDISSDLRACEASLTMLREPIDAIGTALGLPGRDAGVSVNGSTPAPSRNGTSHAPQKHELVTMAGEK